MKRKLRIVIGCLTLACLTACQNQKTALSESYWEAAKQAGNLQNYVKEHADEIDVETLKEEAGSAKGSLSQQLKATALLCALEYQNSLQADDSRDLAELQLTNKAKDSLFQFDYPISSSYADSYLAKVNTEGGTFWKSFNDAFYPYDCFLPVFAAANHLDGQTLVNLINGIPANSSYHDKFKDAVDRWVKAKPEKIAAVGDHLTSAQYFEDWKLEDWKQAYFYNYTNPGLIHTDTVDEAITYVSYLRGSMLPMLESEFEKEEFQETSEITGENYYSTKLTVTVDQQLPLQEPDESNMPETIETEGRKVAAFYRNPHTEEWKDSPAPLRILGDFMLGLSEEEYPQSLEEADYYLVLTPSYEYGDFYQDRAGNDTKIQQVYSSTSIDLYEAKTGAFLRHLGNVMEIPQSLIFKDLSQESVQYPELTDADVLSYIYHNVNEPDAYVGLTDHILGLTSEPQKGEPVILGNWEITYHSCQVAKTFERSMFRFTAKDGCQFIRGRFSITNRGIQKDTFLPMIYSIAEDPVVQLTDSKRENLYNCVHVLQDGSCLNNTTLEPGEAKDGQLVFEVPDEVAQGTDPLYVKVSLGNQAVFYPLDK